MLTRFVNFTSFLHFLNKSTLARFEYWGTSWLTTDDYYAGSLRANVWLISPKVGHRHNASSG